jgi:predicted unusual protein kinase regulating ubiquinone biosynthesis (AarF/ABC1/UbiB family)
VLVMDFIPGTPLSRLNEEMAARGLSSNSAEAKLLGRKLLISLTEAYGRMIFGTGFIHGDPHPGNIFVMPGGQVLGICLFKTTKFFSRERISKINRAVILVMFLHVHSSF